MSHQRSLGPTMWENAEYVEKELPKLFLSDEMRARIVKLCALWKETYFDLGGDTSQGLLDRWVRQAIDEADQVVRALDAASKEDSRYSSAYILVSESAVNVLNAFAEPPVVALPIPASHDAEPKATFHERLMHSMVDNLNQASTASSKAPPKEHFFATIAQSMVDNLNAKVLAEEPPPNAEDLKVIHQQRRLAGIPPGVSWKAPTLTSLERAYLLMQVKALELSDKKPEVRTSGPHRQSSGDFWREQWANGLTEAEHKAMLESLPPIVPMSHAQVPAPVPAKPSYWTRTAAIIRAVKKNLQRPR